MRHSVRGAAGGSAAAMRDAADGLDRSCSAAVARRRCVMVKGSLGSQMAPIVEALEERFPGKPRCDEAAARAELMFYWLIDLSSTFSPSLC